MDFPSEPFTRKHMGHGQPCNSSQHHSDIYGSALGGIGGTGDEEKKDNDGNHSAGNDASSAKHHAVILMAVGGGLVGVSLATALGAYAIVSHRKKQNAF